MSLRKKISTSIIYMGSSVCKYSIPRERVHYKRITNTRNYSDCVSAIIRLAYTVKYVTSDDSVYTVSSMTLAATAEMTCGFIVFGLPYAVKVFNSESVIFKLLTSFSSWVGLTTRQQGLSSEDQEQKWSQKTPAPKPSREYLMLEEVGGVPSQIPSPKGSSTTSGE
ncbi:hypothetical protein F5B20DRAFT_594234 [Whalleya microplaca]|nr:hypothetical protein F5B20DRAFT_594234 [Whalleya microplaca]